MEASRGFGNAAQAVAAWRETLGPGRVLDDAGVLDRYARSTQREGTRPCCVVYPESTQDVQAAVRIASEHGVVVYPVSRGHNWGYGDACAPTAGAAILDLSRMNRIVSVDSELAYCVIEPGVSQKQLYDYLHGNDTGLWMDCTAAGPDTSIVGNALERGIGHTRYGDHVRTCCGMEVVLADGRVLNTGFGHFPNAQATHLYPYGLGPQLDGLFFQSNFGIVTKFGLWLMPAPEAFTFYYVQADRHEDMPYIVDAMRRLKLEGVINTAVHIGNDFRVWGGTGRFPWHRTGGEAPIPPDVREQLRRETGVRAWQASGSFTGTAGHVRASKAALRKALGNRCRVVFVDDRKLARGESLANVLNTFGFGSVLREKMRGLRPNYELLKGNPVLQTLLSAQWRLRRPPEGPGNPLDSGCGAYWVSPVVPMTGGHAERFYSRADAIMSRHGFDTNVSLILVNERALVCTVSVAFDKSVNGEPEQAEVCYQELMDTFLEEGYVIYRCGIQGMPKIRAHESVFWDVTAQLKAAIDPRDIIARGRYVPPLNPDQ